MTCHVTRFRKQAHICPCSQRYVTKMRPPNQYMPFCTQNLLGKGYSARTDRSGLKILQQQKSLHVYVSSALPRVRTERKAGNAVWKLLQVRLMGTFVNVFFWLLSVFGYLCGMEIRSDIQPLNFMRGTA